MKRLVVVAIAGAVVLIGRTTLSSQSKPTPPTFAKDVAPIVQKNCMSCHRDGQAAPFPLVTYDDVKKRGQLIADVTEDRYMPPWHAARAEGFPEFQDERSLTAAQIKTLRAWVDGGMPSGDLKTMPAPPKFPEGWSLGTPDLVVKLPQPVPLAAEGRDQYRNVVIAVDLPDDKWITAIDYQPSARSIVHHALYFTSPAGVTVRDDETIPGLGLGALGRGGLGGGVGAGRGAAGAGRGGAGIGAAGEAWGGLGGWVPGATPRFFPEGIAQPLPKHTNLVLQLHLHPSGKAESENGSIAIYFAKSTPRASIAGVQVPPAFGVGMGIDIPAGESNFAIADSFVLPVDVDAFGVRGHAHYLAHEMKMTATLPDGSTRGLLWIKDWDFSWQDSYYYKDPIALPKGTKIDVRITYDNSAGNPRNPSTPVRRVRWGRESFDEMGSMTLLTTTRAAGDQQILRAATAQHLRAQILRRFR